MNATRTTTVVMENDVALWKNVLNMETVSKHTNVPKFAAEGYYEANSAMIAFIRL